MKISNDFKSFKKTPFLSSKAIKDHIGLLDGYQRNIDQLLKEIRKLKKGSSNPNCSDYRSHLENCRHNYNGVILHRLYFSQIKEIPSQVPKSIKRFIEETNKHSQTFRNFEEWKEDFFNVAKASRGWAILGYSVFEDCLGNVAVDGHDYGLPPGFIPFLVLDVWEHAYIADFGTNREKYIKAWFKHINWDEIDVVIARWLPVVKSEDLVMKVTASIQHKMITLGLAKE